MLYFPKTILTKKKQSIYSRILMIIKEIVLRLLVLIALSLTTLRYVYFMYAIFSKSNRKRAPYVPSFDRQLRLMKDHLKLKPNSTMVDLGCGDGKALRFFIKYYHLKRWDGFDINLIALTYGKIINKIRWIKNIHLYKRDFFKADIKDYDYIYLYLWESQMALMEDLIFSNMKKECIVISNSFRFAKHEPFETIKNKRGRNALFLYRK